MTEVCLVYITVGSRDNAKVLGRNLVESRLAACVNILHPMTSLYWWDEDVEEAEETVMIAKTRASLVDALTERVLSLHDYDCPCVIALPVSGGNQGFLDWICGETRPAPGEGGFTQSPRGPAPGRG